MKKLLPFSILMLSLFIGISCKSQDKKPPASPPAEVKQVIKSGAEITINYSQPSVKGRTIGKDLEPKDGVVWRTGANAATVFETSKALKINGKDLPAGKYSLFSIAGADSWTIIFNKTWNQWGAYEYKEAADALRVAVKPEKADPFAEKMTFTIDKSGVVTLLWGGNKIAFTAE